MKRAKIMLIAIAVIATVGGALAFKAQKFSTQNVYCKTNVGPAACVSVAFITPTVIGQATFTTPCSISHAALGLPTTSYYTNANCPALVPAIVNSTIVP